jgi:hypothetical protein
VFLAHPPYLDACIVPLKPHANSAVPSISTSMANATIKAEFLSVESTLLPLVAQKRLK